MRVVASRVSIARRRFDRAVGNAREGWRERTSALLALRDDAGRIGLGEASPLPGFSPDDVTTCARALEEMHVRLGAIDEASPVDAVAKALGGALVEVPAARFAVETALLDLIGQSRGISVAACLSGDGVTESVPRSALLGAPGRDAQGCIDHARRAKARGIRVFKAKIGDPNVGLSAEIAALGELRHELGASAIRLDANGAWSVAQARDALARLEALEPEFVEEPVGGDALVDLGVCAVPWAADDSLASAERRTRLLDASGCATVVLKPSLLGGLLAARDLARRARERGRDVVVTHMFEGAVAHAAACELALSLGPATRACGLDTHAGLADEDVPQLARAGFVCASGRAGLGFDANRSRALAP
jgi:o-succinylbenzoate synthase